MFLIKLCFVIFLGRFPERDNVQEFKRKLFEGIDLNSDWDWRWPASLHDFPRRMAKLKEISKFDTNFCNVNPKQANCMDLYSWILWEASFETIMDAGYNPNYFKVLNNRTFIGVSNFKYWHTVIQKGWKLMVSTILIWFKLLFNILYWLQNNIS